MKFIRHILYTVLVVFSGLTASAQTNGTDFKLVDDYVKSLGPLDTLNAGTISFIVTKKFPDAKDKARAIFDWVTYNISFDLKAGRNNDNTKTSTDLVLKTRKATAAGYAGLFQDMCSVVKIRCLTVDGYAKFKNEQIVEKPEELNHTWAVVQLGQSPDTWFYVDPTWGAGYTDEKMTKFTPAFNQDYFFADKTIFNYQHYPDNTAWLLPGASKASGNFFSMPWVRDAAYEFNISKFLPTEGFIKGKANKAISFSLNVQSSTNIEIVALEIGEAKKKKTKTVDHTMSGGSIRFSYKFEEEDTYPVTVLINNKPVLTYMAEISEE